MAVLLDQSPLAALLEERDDPMAACQAPWLKGFRRAPATAAPPLAMSGRHPRATGSYGPEVIKWAKAELGITLRWWQGLAIIRQLEHDKAGELVWREVIESGPRRIGKSTRLRVSALDRLTHSTRYVEQQLAMLVSKDLAVGKEIHRGAWRWCEHKGWNVVRLNGAQEVESLTGDRWLLRAPNAVYGYDVGYGQVDEAWGVDPMAITDGLEPALLERVSPQLHLTSTAHVRASSLMRRRLTAALKNADPDVLLLLWGAHPLADVALEKTWRAASPHWTKDRRDLIARKYAAALAGQDEPEFDDPDPLRGWAAQYLNAWPLLLGPDVETLPGWSDAELEEGERPDSLAIGVSVSDDLTSSSIGAIGQWEDGSYLIGAVARSRGTKGLVEEAARIHREHHCAVVVDPKSPNAEELIADLRATGVAVHVIKPGEYPDGCKSLYAGVRDGQVTHMGDDELEDAARVVVKRTVGDGGWAWARGKSQGDISMLEAVTLAWIGRELDYDIADSFG